MRSDAPLIKHLSKTYSPRLGWEWQRLPYIDVSRQQERIRNSWRHLISSVPDVAPLVWPDAVFYVGRTRDDFDGGWAEVWVRATEGDVYWETASRLSPWTYDWYGHLPATEQARAPRVFEDNGSFVVEYWGADPQSHEFSQHPFVMIYRAADTWRCKPGHATPYFIGERGLRLMRANPATADAIEAMCKTGVQVAAYLKQCPEWLVEESIERVPPPGKPDPKPWTNNFLPQIILLDPTQAPSGDRGQDLGGTHASPRPHQRRGHWATLKHPKYRRNLDGSPRQVFVKPAWVGPREWIMEGNRYRVIDVEGQYST